MIYIAILFVILFTKDFLVINPELVVIAGFLTIFFIFKRLTQDMLVEAFAAYAENIRKTYLSALYLELNAAEIALQTNQLKIKISTNLELYYEYLLVISILFLHKIQSSNSLATVESLNFSLNRILLNIKQLKRNMLIQKLKKKTKIHG